jgi:hypothetical protein
VVYQESETWNDILKWERNSIEIEQKKKKKRGKLKKKIWKANDWVVYYCERRPMIE